MPDRFQDVSFANADLRCARRAPTADARAPPLVQPLRTDSAPIYAPPAPHGWLRDVPSYLAYLKVPWRAFCASILYKQNIAAERGDAHIPAAVSFASPPYGFRHRLSPSISGDKHAIADDTIATNVAAACCSCARAAASCAWFQASSPCCRALYFRIWFTVCAAVRYLISAHHFCAAQHAPSAMYYRLACRARRRAAGSLVHLSIST